MRDKALEAATETMFNILRYLHGWSTRLSKIVRDDYKSVSEETINAFLDVMLDEAVIEYVKGVRN